MATVPAKQQQPLHNFSLPFLKWGQRTQINNHCRRRYRNFPLTDSSDSDLNNCRKPHRFHNRGSRDTKRKIDEEDGGVLLEKGDTTGKSSDVAAAADGDVKPWNLRPRKLVINTGDNNGAIVGVSNAKSGWLLRGVAAASAEEEKVKEKEKEDDQMKKKRRLWISLSKEEIEEDVYAFTGSRPARRPKKRNRTAQKQVDVCIMFFLGYTWLGFQPIHIEFKLKQLRSRD
ncbi:hypothetical protein L2E82_47710 [Cichorium intybus]|uniref:Uncharacterized protein n=1 Tax=Cichorium intybus TaxID=13427 RepID=A0ACB8YWH4_CICIN|nr:hypothetical protein L2E82_47710 [Cichorium intybus]